MLQGRVGYPLGNSSYWGWFSSILVGHLLIDKWQLKKSIIIVIGIHFFLEARGEEICCFIEKNKDLT